MKTSHLLLITAALCSVASIAWFAATPLEPSVAEAGGTGATREANVQPKPESAVTEIPSTRGEAAAEIAHAAFDPMQTISIEQWLQRHEALARNFATREEANAKLVAELDGTLHEAVSAFLPTLPAVSGTGRYDTLAQMEKRIRQIAEVVFGQLGIPGGRHLSALPRTLDAIGAEIQYAEWNCGHDARVALLKLDRERTKRISELFAAHGREAGELAAVSEIEPWYESNLRIALGLAETE